MSQREALLGAFASGTATTIVLVVEPRFSMVAVVCLSAAQGALGAIVRERQKSVDTPMWAAARIAMFSPLPVMPVLFFVFGEALKWPFIGAWSAWGLGFMVVLAALSGDRAHPRG